MQVIDDDGNNFDQENHPYSKVFLNENMNRFEWLNHFFYKGNRLCHPSSLIRMDVQMNDDLFAAGLGALPDFYRWVKLCLKHEIYVHPDKLTKFRIHTDEGNTSGQTPTNRIRVHNEFYQIAKLYGRIQDQSEFLQVFSEANEKLTADHAYKVGCFLGWYYGELKRRNGDHIPARIIIGKDTRRSSYMFEYTLIGGLVASGADAYLLHVKTTPSVAYVARVDEFDCGIMIFANHNPYFDNGIKLINGDGDKMDDETISIVEAYVDGKLEVFGQKWEEIPFAKKEKIGCTVDYVSGRNRYIGYLIYLGVYSFCGVKVALDYANGSSWNIAKAVFDAYGAKKLRDQHPARRHQYQQQCRFYPYRGDCRNTWWRTEWTLVLPMAMMQTAVSA